LSTFLFKNRRSDRIIMKISNISKTDIEIKRFLYFRNILNSSRCFISIIPMFIRKIIHTSLLYKFIIKFSILNCTILSIIDFLISNTNFFIDRQEWLLSAHQLRQRIIISSCIFLHQQRGGSEDGTYQLQVFNDLHMEQNICMV